MKKVRSTVMAAAVLIAMGTLTACGSAASSSNTGNGSGGTSTGNSAGTTTTSSASSNTLYIGLQADPPTLDPMLSTALVDRQIMLNIYDTLIALEPNGSYGPGLAKKWDVSTNGLTVTLHLQTGVKFQDGTPFNAAAVKFNLKRYMQPDSARKAQLSDITSIDTPNSSTVVLHLKKPFSPLIGILSGRSGMMVSPTAVQKEGANFANQPVGTGPYKFKDRVKGDHLTLVANDNYWQGAPKIQKVVYKIFTNPNVELTNLESGAVQLIDTVPASQLSSVKANPNFVVSNTAGLGYQGFYLNTSQAPFNNQYLREAVDAAINRQTIVNVVFKGEASPGWSPFSPASPVYNAKLDTPPAPNNAMVKKYLQEGNKPNGFSFTLQTANSPISAQVAQLIQSMLAQDGIKMKIQELEFGTLLSNNSNHNFQASALGWSGRVDPDQDSYNFWHTGAPDNGSNFSNPTVDKLLQEARTVSSMSQRKQLYDQFVTVMHQQDPYIFLYYPNNTYAYSKNLHGFQPYPDGVFRLRELSLS
ncbi:ABC transporter substrate-binding protein [Alicyclobacillus mengziensis]|uniref:Peptide ABC transporter substrate-binding protein n=1 Tax=Alicyclobacillus mengziensis TaxID=2931921 RepID=A0A9X7VZU8_9BACL|nr:ABC transporter substrate-binding protein [Alicyclobacillus mengziensis]QSO47845.1 peptide ABC transporter substrate-binding protein [Alicyclobacillus mengziensis]